MVGQGVVGSRLALLRMNGIRLSGTMVVKTEMVVFNIYLSVNRSAYFSREVPKIKYRILLLGRMLLTVSNN
jgi:hypothetical protein